MTASSTTCIRRRGSQWTLCKCLPCRQEMRRKVKRNRAGVAVAPDQRAAAKARIARWAAAGYSIGLVSQMTGVRKATLQPHLDGRERLISHATAARVMAAPEAPAAQVGGFVPSIGVSRRLRALTTLGWSMQDLSERCGISASTLAALRDPAHKATRPKYAVVVTGLYDELCMTKGECAYAATRALRKGWLPPLAWDDIDDPDEDPTGNVEAVQIDEVAVERLMDGSRVDATRAERLEAVRRLAGRGDSDTEIGERLHVTDRTITRWRTEHHIESRWEEVHGLGIPATLRRHRRLDGTYCSKGAKLQAAVTVATNSHRVLVQRSLNPRARRDYRSQVEEAKASLVEVTEVLEQHRSTCDLCSSDEAEVAS